jgi:hypothetical protein
MIQAEKLGMGSRWFAAFAGTKVVEIRGTVSPESEKAANSTDSVWRIPSGKSSNFPDSVWEITEKEAGGEAVAEFAGPRDALGSGEAFVDEVKRGEQEQRLVRTLVRTPLLHRCGAGMEVVEPFNGGVGIHGRRKAFVLLDWKNKGSA